MGRDIKDLSEEEKAASLRQYVEAPGHWELDCHNKDDYGRGPGTHFVWSCYEYDENHVPLEDWVRFAPRDVIEAVRGEVFMLAGYHPISDPVARERVRADLLAMLGEWREVFAEAERMVREGDLNFPPPGDL